MEEKFAIGDKKGYAALAAKLGLYHGKRVRFFAAPFYLLCKIYFIPAVIIAMV